MKKLLIFTGCLLFAFGISAQTNVSKLNKKNKNQLIKQSESIQTPKENLVLKETEFDFGKIPQGKPVTHIFEFKNEGDTPLTLTTVQASCGCTTPEWNKDEVKPGATSSIKVGYNAAAEGSFNKAVTITYNGNQTTHLIIKGEVWKTPVTSAPENTSLNNLQNQP